MDYMHDDQYTDNLYTRLKERRRSKIINKSSPSAMLGNLCSVDGKGIIQRRVAKRRSSVEGHSLDSVSMSYAGFFHLGGRDNGANLTAWSHS